MCGHFVGCGHLQLAFVTVALLHVGAGGAGGAVDAGTLTPGDKLPVQKLLAVLTAAISAGKSRMLGFVVVLLPVNVYSTKTSAGTGGVQLKK